MIWEFSNYEIFMSFSFIACLMYIIGWLCDGILQKMAFGHIGNWLLLLAGVFTAMYTFNSYGYEFNTYPLFTLGCLAGGTCAFFLVICFSKRFLV